MERLPSYHPASAKAKLLAVILAGLAMLGGCRLTSIPLWGPAEPNSSDANLVERHNDIPYHKDADDGAWRQLDLFLPKGKKNFPVVILVHGGAWMIGDNRCCGLYSSVGEFLASQGIGVVMPNYALSPWVKHPQHVKDVARVVAWTHENIARHGGCPDEIFLAGHSAGGHLVSLLATDETYLKAEALRSAHIKGVISISGVYRIPEEKMAIRLGGSEENSLRFEHTSPIRKESRARLLSGIGPGVPVQVDVFAPAFGRDPETRRNASPASHVRPGLPPFLIVSAEKDLPTLNAVAMEFHQALLDRDCQSEFLKVPKRNHNSILFLAIQNDDPVAAAMLDFIRRRSGKPENQGQ